jgi:serine/threonine-protein kinase
MRKAVSVGLPFWWLFTATDWLMARYVAPSDFSFYVLLRVAGGAVLALVLARLRRSPRPSWRLLWALDVAAYTAPALLIALMCLRIKGIASPYATGTIMVLIVRGTTMPDRWTRAALLGAGPALAFPLTMLAGMAVSPALRSELQDPAALATFALNLAFIACAHALMVTGGHIVWSLRRQVFEARSLGRYTLKRRLGSGGMGEVWLASHRTMKQDVAVKILKQSLDGVQEPLAVRRLEREVKAMTRLRHPNTVRVFDYGVTEDGLWFYAMELLDGEDLATIVKRSGPFAPARAIRVVGQAVRALAEAHALGIVHRDVKPGNIILAAMGGERDFVKVIDFGIAKVPHATLTESLTGAGDMLGTPAYMAPEAFAGDEIDAPADVYAIGAVLYFLLAGKPPFEGNGSVGGFMAGHLRATPVPPSRKLGAPLPVDLEAVVARCLEKAPAARFASMAELRVALEACASTSE